MFDNARSFNKDISKWNVSNIINMRYMFYSTIAFDQDISKWNVSSISIMDDMFTNAYTFNYSINLLRTIQSWNTCCGRTLNNLNEQPEQMLEMFKTVEDMKHICDQLENLPPLFSCHLGGIFYQNAFKEWNDLNL
jgi:surface protein